MFKFWALKSNAQSPQTCEGCRWTPFDLMVHVDHVFFEETFIVFRSILRRCEMCEAPQSCVEVIRVIRQILQGCKQNQILSIHLLKIEKKI